MTEKMELLVHLIVSLARLLKPGGINLEKSVELPPEGVKIT
jgi:hypothetical protein